MILLALAGCELFAGTEPPGVTVTEFAGLDDGASWTWRDAADTGLPIAEELVHGHHTGEGMVELRRGVQWGSAEPVGYLEWDTQLRLGLAGWEFGEDGGDELITLANDGALDGDITFAKSGSCAFTLPEGVDTYYAHFTDVAQFVCSGTSLDGTYYFARTVGLIRLEADAFDLDLIAPY